MIKASNSIYILGVKVSQVNFGEAADMVKEYINSPNMKSSYIVTPNPEIVLLASKLAPLKKIINDSFLSLADGVGIVWAANFLRPKKALPGRVAGADMMLKLCHQAQASGWQIGLLGGKGVAKAAGEKLKEKYPGLKISYSVENEEDLPKEKVELLFVAYGAPKQEEVVSRLVTQHTFKLAMVVGGTFDYLAGRIPRAPQAWQELKLEWLWRLIQEPQRWRRILSATVVFPMMVIREKIMGNGR